MKSSKLGTLPVVASIIVVLSIMAGGLLQTLTLKLSQKMSHSMHSQLVFIQAVKVAQLLKDAGDALGGFAMSKSPQFAEKFNSANVALPKAMEELGNLGPFEGQEAEAVSQFKQNMSEAMMAMGKMREIMTATADGDMSQRRHGYMLFRTMKESGEKIQTCLVRLEPMGGIGNCLQDRENLEREAATLRMTTVAWLLFSILSVLFLIATMATRLRQAN